MGREAPFGQAQLTIQQAGGEACLELESPTSSSREVASNLPSSPQIPPCAQAPASPRRAPGARSHIISFAAPGSPEGGGRWTRSFIFGARVGTRQAARRRSPVAARAPSRFAWKAVAAPRVRPRATGPSLHLDEREGSPPGRSLGGSRPQRGSASFRKEARGPESGGGPRASRAATHLVARGSHMAGAAASGAASRGTDAAGAGGPRGVSPARSGSAPGP